MVFQSVFASKMQNEAASHASEQDEPPVRLLPLVKSCRSKVYHISPTINWLVVSNIFYVHPSLGKMNPVWRSYFSNGLNQTTNHRHLLYANHIHTWPHLGTIWTCGNFGPFGSTGLGLFAWLAATHYPPWFEAVTWSGGCFVDGVFFSTEYRHDLYTLIINIYIFIYNVLQTHLYTVLKKHPFCFTYFISRYILI